MTLMLYGLKTNLRESILARVEALLSAMTVHLLAIVRPVKMKRIADKTTLSLTPDVGKFSTEF